MNDNVEPLYFGDKRMDSLYNSILKEIMDRAEKQDITVAEAVGVLELVKLDLRDSME